MGRSISESVRSSSSKSTPRLHFYVGRNNQLLKIRLSAVRLRKINKYSRKPANLSNPSITHSWALMIRFKLLLAKNEETRSGPNLTIFPVPAGSLIILGWIPSSIVIIILTIVYLNLNLLDQTIRYQQLVAVLEC